MNYDVNITSLEYRSLLFTALPGFYAPEEAYCLCLASIISKAAQAVDFCCTWTRLSWGFRLIRLFREWILSSSQIHFPRRIWSRRKSPFLWIQKKNEGGGKSCYKNDEQQTDEERWWFSKTFRWTVCLVIRSMKCCIRRQLLNRNHRRGDATSSWGLKIEAQIMIWRLQLTVFRITWIKVKFMQLQWSHDEGNKKWNENFVRMGRHTKAGV